MLSSIMHLHWRHVLITLASSNYPKYLLGIVYINDIVGAIFRTQRKISKIELFAKKVNGFLSLTILAKSSILDN